MSKEAAFFILLLLFFIYNAVVYWKIQYFKDKLRQEQKENDELREQVRDMKLKEQGVIPFDPIARANYINKINAQKA